LDALVTTHFQRKIVEGHIFVFINKLRNRIKVLWWGGNGLLLLQKKLLKGLFVAPWQHSAAQALCLTLTELNLLLEGCQHVVKMSFKPDIWQPKDNSMQFV